MFFYPTICWWTPKLFPYPSWTAWLWSGHASMSVVGSKALWVYTQEMLHFRSWHPSTLRCITGQGAEKNRPGTQSLNGTSSSTPLRLREQHRKGVRENVRSGGVKGAVFYTWPSRYGCLHKTTRHAKSHFPLLWRCPAESTPYWGAVDSW